MDAVAASSLAQAALAPTAPSTVALSVLSQVQQFPEDLVSRLFASIGIGQTIDARA